MPPDMAVDMRRSKLKASEAAILAGEVNKPSWQSRNEGIHERVSFEDTIWGFDLAGGSFYKTPLRVVAVKADSRAEKAGIRMGDKLTRINDIDTSTLTIQEAHEIIVESGVHLRLAVSAPEDEEDSYYCYEDPVEDGYDSDEERRLQEELDRKRRQVHAKVSSYWSLQWPWVSKRRVIYRESNCFMVPSKYEDNHRDKFSPLPMLKTQEDIVLESTKSENDNLTTETDQNEKKENTVVNGNESIPNSSKDNNKKVVGKKQDTILNETVNAVEHNGINGSLGKIPEVEEDNILDSPVNSQTDVSVDELFNNEAIEPQHEIIDEVSSDTDLHNELMEESSSKTDKPMDSKDDTADEISLSTDEVTSPQNDEIINEVLDTNDEISSRADEVISPQDDEIINEVLDQNNNVVSKVEEDKILDSILSDGEAQSIENTESKDKR